MPRRRELELLARGRRAWNAWRAGHRRIRPRLQEADLTGSDLRGLNLRRAGFREARLSEADLRGVDLTWADFRRAYLRGVNMQGSRLRESDLSRTDMREAKLRGAILRGVDLREADAREADFRGTDLRKADLRGARLVGARMARADLREARLGLADLTLADLRGADLRGADLSSCRLVDSDLRRAHLSGCRVFRVAAWGVELEGASQADLVITREKEPLVAVDGLEIAQCMGLVLASRTVRSVIAHMAMDGVLIVGCFSPDRRGVLDAIRNGLRRRHYAPILYDPAGTSSQDSRETLSALGRLARFVIADLSQPDRIFKDLQAIIPALALPVQPIRQAAGGPASESWHRPRSPWQLKVYEYPNLEHLTRQLPQKVIRPAEARTCAGRDSSRRLLSGARA